MYNIKQRDPKSKKQKWCLISDIWIPALRYTCVEIGQRVAHMHIYIDIETDINGHVRDESFKSCKRQQEREEVGGEGGCGEAKGLLGHGREKRLGKH